MTENNVAPAIELVGIDKSFGAVHANKGICLNIAGGSIHGIVGENGAGKSTLMSILYGFYKADAGEIFIKGEKQNINSSQDAIDAGIGMVHQHFMLVDTFSVLENIILGAEGGALLKKGVDKAREELNRLEREYELEVDIDALVEDLPVGLQQRVEILKALYRGAQILILDEPTGVLTPQEADHLFRILNALKDQGKTVVLITHKLREIMAITDAVSVMRRGEMVAHRETANTSTEELAELMVGRKVLLRVEKGEASPKHAVLEVENLTAIDKLGVTRVKGVSFNVRAGEIVGIAGVSGNGQSDLLDALSGITKVTDGKILINGNPFVGGPPQGAADVRQMGMAHVPEDRQRMGLVIPFEAWESSILGYHNDEKYRRGPIIDRPKVIGDSLRLMQAFDVRPQDPNLVTGNFSGGNQQKIVLAREIDRDPDILLVGQPTRGVDIGAIEFIHKRLIEMRDAGKAVLLVSVELDEILSLSDRILVMFDGQIMGEVSPADATERILGCMMAGIEPTDLEVA
ncbi:MAG: ABC transporter ATP-binding protein [Rhodospirillales bacterium]|nr:ABC transporter ATP-binding protein [Rhodospirillales bacterium]